MSALAGTVITLKVRPGTSPVANFPATLPALTSVPWTFVTTVVNRAGIFVTSSTFSYAAGGSAVSVSNINQQAAGGSIVAWSVTAQWGAPSTSNSITQQLTTVTSLWA